MLATYYAIYEYDERTQERGNIVLHGIVRHTEDTICPQQETGIEALPHECELHKFEADGYRIEKCNFVISRDYVIANRTTGDRIQ